MTIEGDYTSFAHLETLYLGVLARRTLITTNVVRVLEAANGKPIIFMPARHDHHRVQTGRRLRGPRRRPHRRPAHRRHDGRAGLLVGRQGRRHRASRADQRLRRKHRPRRHEVRRVGSRRHQRHGARRLREQLGRDGARGRAGARTAALGSQARHVRVARRPFALERAGRLQADWCERTARPEGARGARPTTASSTSRSSSPAASTPSGSEPSRNAVCRSTPTGSARRSSAARTTSQPMSS